MFCTQHFSGMEETCKQGAEGALTFPAVLEYTLVLGAA
jgi:hypothetical protein